jgi:hypothetical protein
MSVLRSNQSLSPIQKRVNRVVPLLSCLVGIAFGLWVAKDCAAITSGYEASYSNVLALFVGVALCVLGLLMLIYWRTRWVGAGLIAAGILSYAAFWTGIAVLLKEDRVAWTHEQEISFGPDQKASAVIYFRKEITDQQVEDFDSTVLMLPALPGRSGRDYPTFVTVYLHLLPDQANGHLAVALTFLNNAPPDEVKAYLARIQADSRVETVFLNTSPNSIHADSKHL